LKKVPIEDLDPSRPLAGSADLVGDYQQAVRHGQRVRPHVTVRQSGLGKQPWPGRVGDVQHAEIHRPVLVGQVEIALPGTLEQCRALAAVPVAAKVMLAEQPHPAAFHRMHRHPLRRTRTAERRNNHLI
jgi:hypothetical protein